VPTPDKIAGNSFLKGFRFQDESKRIFPFGHDEGNEENPDMTVLWENGIGQPGNDREPRASALMGTVE
jgi:hypothetical protein